MNKFKIFMERSFCFFLVILVCLSLNLLTCKTFRTSKHFDSLKFDSFNLEERFSLNYYILQFFNLVPKISQAIYLPGLNLNSYLVVRSLNITDYAVNSDHGYVISTLAYLDNNWIVFPEQLGLFKFDSFDGEKFSLNLNSNHERKDFSLQCTEYVVKRIHKIVESTSEKILTREGLKKKWIPQLRLNKKHIIRPALVSNENFKGNTDSRSEKSKTREKELKLMEKQTIATIVLAIIGSISLLFTVYSVKKLKGRKKVRKKRKNKIKKA